MKRNRFLPAALSLCLAAALSTGVLAADRTEEETASAYLSEQGIMVGDQNGSMNLDSSLTRAELAAILTRLNGNLEHIEAEQHYYRNRCVFPDVPEWAKLYVGYCNVHGLMKGYDNGRFGSGDPVTPAAACTVLLRYSEFYRMPEGGGAWAGGQFHAAGRHDQPRRLGCDDFPGTG